MKMCENCGVPVDDDFSFATCPRCLLGEALAPAGLRGDFSLPPLFRPGRFSHLQARPDFFEKYELLERIGVGGQGDVWKVWDFEFRRIVAMKRLGQEVRESEAAAYRFLAEAQITSQLDHPGILPVFDVGLDPDGKLFYTTQLLPGTTFGDVWRSVHAPGPSAWTLNQALELLVRVCEIVAHAHDRGVIHRDLKPDNVLVGAFGEVRVIDWGSAHIQEASRAAFEEPFVRLHDPSLQTDRAEAIAAGAGLGHATASAGLPVTTVFAPPELLRGDLRQLGPRTDVYALGVMLYELLAGQVPYGDDAGKLPRAAKLKDSILAGPPRPLRRFKPSISRDLAAVCEKAMAHDRLARYHSAAELAADIHAVLAGWPARARRPGPLVVLQKWAARNSSYVLTGSASLVVVAAVLSFAHGWKVQRDSARQAQDARNAEWAARNGHWREAIQDWDQAAADGYQDTVYLDLQKAAAWTELSEPAQSGALLRRLAARTDLGSQRGPVLLRLGEHELFERLQADDGVKLVRAAIAAGLPDADLLLARGLLAGSTPEALDLFHQAVRHNPYLHAAHVNGLGLEFLLGHHQELANHLTVFKILYPDDPSPAFIAAAELALAGNLPAAQAELASVRSQVNSNDWNAMTLSCRAFAADAKLYDLDRFLAEQPSARTPLDQFQNDPWLKGTSLSPAGVPQPAGHMEGLRMAELPSLQAGLILAQDGVDRLRQPFWGNPALAVGAIERGWAIHPEGLMPAIGAMLLENRQPKSGPPLAALLEIQARLYQMAADSPSVVPQMNRLARYLAARTQFELVARGGASSPSARTNCLAQIRRAAALPDTSAAETRAYFPFALGLGDNDLALQLVRRLEQQQPADPLTRRSRIQADLALGDFGHALEQVSRLLAEHPHDAWALARRQAALDGVRRQFEENNLSR